MFMVFLLLFNIAILSGFVYVLFVLLIFILVLILVFIFILYLSNVFNLFLNLFIGKNWCLFYDIFVIDVFNDND